jgi:hypothetical protein
MDEIRISTFSKPDMCLQQIYAEGNFTCIDGHLDNVIPTSITHVASGETGIKEVLKDKLGKCI